MYDEILEILTSAIHVGDNNFLNNDANQVCYCID